jgi:Fe-S-cluster containining protein
MKPMIDETNLDVALANAKENANLLLLRMPKPLEVKESKLYQKFKRHKGSPQKKLEALYEEIESIYAYVNDFTPCKKGCDHCCYIPVSVSEVEIALIEKSQKIKRRKTIKTTRLEDNSPCPFLIGGKCSIYEVRPFACRRHVALTKTSHWCETSRCNDAEFTLLRFSEIEKSFDLIRREANSADVLEIREVFTPK